VYAAKLAQPRMGDDPRQSVVDRNLQVHDTPGLSVFSGAVFPTCTGVNPHLTLMALTAHATAQVIERLGAGRIDPRGHPSQPLRA
jgi:choline dehydrogenase-like flavoprotein